MQQAKTVLRNERPFHTHLSPECRVFSQAYHPQHDERLDPQYWIDIALADNIIALAMFIHNLGLFASIECPRYATIWNKVKMMALSRLPGWFFVDFDGCMFGLLHPVTGKPVRKAWRLLTNAWYLIFLGRLCSGHVEHTPLEGIYTNWSAVYPWDWCVEFSRLVKRGRVAVRDFWNPAKAVYSIPELNVLHPGRISGVYPNRPMVYPRDEFVDRLPKDFHSTEPRVGAIVEGEDVPEELPDPSAGSSSGPAAAPVAAAAPPLGVEPLPVYSQLDHLGLSEKERVEYQCVVKIVEDLGVPVINMTHATRTDGREEFTLKFAQPVYSMRLMKDVVTMSIPCIRSGTSPGHGHETAAIVADLIVRASQRKLEAGAFGVGTPKVNGFHGGKDDMFYLHEASDATRDWWDVRSDTFLAPATFCTNHAFVRTTRNGSKQYKCLGHPVDKVLPDADDPLRYADGTELTTRMKAETFLQNMITITDKVGTKLPAGTYDCFVGYDDDNHELLKPPSIEAEEATKMLTQYYWSKRRQPVTALLLFYGATKVEPCERDHTYFVAWKTGTRMPVGYTMLDGDAETTTGNVGLDEPIGLPRDRGVKVLERNNTMVFFVLSEPCEGLTVHNKELEELGFVVPQKLKTTALADAMTKLGIERLRYVELVRTGQDTRAIAALLWFLSPEAVEYTEVRVEPILGDEVDGGDPSGVPGSGPIEAEGGEAPYPEVTNLDVEVNGFHHALQASDLPRIHQVTGVSIVELRTAWPTLVEHRMHYGLLQRHRYNHQTGFHEWFTVVPEGGWKSVTWQGKTRRYSLRKYIVMLFHDSGFGGHRDRDHTHAAIFDAGLFWTTMKVDIDGHIRACQTCRWAKGRTLVTGLMRSREMEGPFRVLIIDFVGPQHPRTLRGMLYMFTCICPFSGWYWAIPCATDDSLEAARVFAERVVFDLAGVPVLLCSDRAKAFVEGVITYLNKTFAIESVLGSSIHPQTQGPVERPHRVYKALCKQYMDELGNQWDMVAPIFQWTIRTNCKVYNGRFTPYEIITGMKPRTPIDSLLSTPAVQAKRETDVYVQDLVKYVKKVHQFVQTEHARVREHEQELRVRKFGADTHIEIGDYVMLKTQLPAPVGESAGKSVRFRHDVDKRLFQIHSATGGDPAKARTYTLMDPATGSTEFEFAQPVSADRLIAVEVLPLTHAHDEKTKIRSGNREGEVTATCVDGRVHVRWNGRDDTEVVDLSRLPHEFMV